MADTTSAYAWPSFGAADGQTAQARAREEAAARGYAEGKARAEAETKHHREALARALEDLHRRIEDLGEAQARAVTELAFAVARKLLIAELRTNPVVLRGLVDEALRALECDMEHVQVLVNPDDHDTLEAALARGGSGTTLPKLRLEADAAVPPGGVSIALGARSVEFDPLGRLESFLEEEMSGDAACCPAVDPDPTV